MKFTCCEQFDLPESESLPTSHDSILLADTQRFYNVESTSMRRHDVASTLMRRCLNIACQLGSLSPFFFFFFFLIFKSGTFTCASTLHEDHATRHSGKTGSGQLGPKTSRPRTTRPRKKSAQDNSAQVVPISEDNSAQIAKDHSAHKNHTRHLLMYCDIFIALYLMNSCSETNMIKS